MIYKPMPSLTTHQITRFWSRVQRSRGCWEWQGARQKGGYGAFSIKRSLFRANRLAYYLTFGMDPGNSQVCHECDNPPCCRPDHLFLGTHQENMDDCVLKGRLYRPGPRDNKGSKNQAAKLTEATAAIIKFSTATNVQLAQQFGVSEMIVSLIKRGKRWSHVTRRSA